MQFVRGRPLAGGATRVTSIATARSLGRAVFRPLAPPQRLPPGAAAARPAPSAAAAPAPPAAPAAAAGGEPEFAAMVSDAVVGTGAAGFVSLTLKARSSAGGAGPDGWRAMTVRPVALRGGR